MSVVSDRLRELRGSSSQSEMARAVNVKQQNWARWESGVVTPSAEMLATICRVHACSADWLLGLRGGESAAAAPAAPSPPSRSPLAVPQSPSPGELPACSKCPYKKKWQKIEAMK